MSAPVVQERDRLPGRLLSAIGVGWLVLTALATLWAVDLMHRRQGDLGYAPPRRTEVAPVEIGIVDQTQIRTFHLAGRHRAEAEAHLRSWGWVDPDRGVVHMPVDAAVRVMLGEPP